MRIPAPSTRSLCSCFAALAGVLASGCGEDAPPAPPSPAPQSYAVEAPGPYPVGSATVELEDTARGRALRVEIWYPAAEGARAAAEAGTPIEAFAAEGPEREQLAALVAAAPDPGTSRRAHAAVDAPPAEGGAWPVAAFSHCYNCTRFSTFSIAERLASHGIAVVAPDHAGGTLFDELAGNAAPLGTEFLEVRAGDIEFVLDRVLDAAAPELPEGLRGRFDPARAGVFGHSFGGVTAGLVMNQDPRPRAALALAVPMENPLLPGVSVAAIHAPLFFVVATEDNSIGEIGNDFIRQNYADANPPVWKVEVEDAGHWSFTDICGIVADFRAGCTADDVRQTTGEPFTYLDIEVARAAAQAYTTAFFAAALLDDEEARDYLSRSRPEGVAEAETRQ
jgi:predicted dienelactone hydrolase